MTRRLLMRLSACLAMAIAINIVGVRAATEAELTAPPMDAPGGEATRGPESVAKPQGPAIDTPQEILDMLNQRQHAIERREEALRTEEARLLALKNDIEQLLARQEQLAKTAQAAKNIKQKPADSDAAEKAAVDQVVKIYETMPPEEAAARLEKLPADMALRVLRSLKGKTAGAILASVKPDKAAKLTERFFTGSPIQTSKAVR